MLETAIAQEREKFFIQGKAEGQAEGLAKGEALGLAKGEAQGLAKGQALGRTEGQAELLITLLEKRFNPLSTEQKTFIYQLNSNELLALSEKLWQAQTLADIFTDRE